jgi:NAD-dependent SIR2 family protein deacetylase
MKLFSEHNQEFHKILDLAMSDELLIFVGAGCSIEAGLPDWKRLVSRYINLALLIQSEMELTPDAADPRKVIPQELLENFGQPGHIAVIADAIVGQHRRNEILSLALYPEAQQPKPGPTAKEIANLYRARRDAKLKATHIVTTNYDPLLELALEKYYTAHASDAITPKGFGLSDVFPGSTTSDRQSPEDEAPLDALMRCFESRGDKHQPKVFHLHGSVDFRKNSESIEPVLLTEQDYAKSQHLAQLALSELLVGKNCLMVGLSLEDNDVLTALYSKLQTTHNSQAAPPKGSRYVVAFNDLRVTKATIEPDESTDKWLDEEYAGKQITHLESQRLQLLDVSPLKHLKNFAQIPQVIHEMGLAVDLGQTRQKLKTASAYWKSKQTYDDRLKLWKEKFAIRYALSGKRGAERKRFERMQRQVSGVIQRTLDNILEEQIELTAVSDELAMHVWARHYDSEELEMFLWGGNEYARVVPNSLSRKVEHSEFDIPIRQAFEGVASRTLLPASKHSRWSQIMAVPVISSMSKARHPYGRLLLGVVTLSTNLPPGESDLTDCLEERQTLVGEIEKRLCELGTTLLVDELQNK